MSSLRLVKISLALLLLAACSQAKASKLTPAASPSPTAAVAVASPSPSAAVAEKGWKDWQHKATGFAFLLPENWKVTEEGDILSVADPDEEVYAEFYSPKSIRDLDKQLNEIDKELSRNLKSLKYDNPTKTVEGGVTEYYLTGRGVNRKSGEEIEFDVGVYEKGDKVLLFYCETGTEDFKKWDPTFTKIVNSIK